MNAINPFSQKICVSTHMHKTIICHTKSQEARRLAMVFIRESVLSRLEVPVSNSSGLQTREMEDQLHSGTCLRSLEGG